jgi:outer membrane protein TolC
MNYRLQTRQRQLQQQLQFAKETLKLRRKAFNDAQRALQKTLVSIVALENQIERIHLAEFERGLGKHDGSERL